MEYGRIQLGAKKGSGKSLDRVPSQGFFYGGDLKKVGLSIPDTTKSFPVGFGWYGKMYPARQHLILQTICRQRRGTGVERPSPRFHILEEREKQVVYLPLPTPFQDNFLPVMINKPFQSGEMVNSPKKVNCCTGWNRATPRLRHGCCFNRGHHAGTAKTKQCPGSGDRLRPGTPNLLG